MVTISIRNSEFCKKDGRIKWFSVATAFLLGTRLSASCLSSRWINCEFSPVHYETLLMSWSRHSVHVPMLYKLRKLRQRRKQVVCTCAWAVFARLFLARSVRATGNFRGVLVLPCHSGCVLFILIRLLWIEFPLVFLKTLCFWDCYVR